MAGTAPAQAPPPSHRSAPENHARTGRPQPERYVDHGATVWPRACQHLGHLPQGASKMIMFGLTLRAARPLLLALLAAPLAACACGDGEQWGSGGYSSGA